ncbi:MAG: 3-oxoacyl-[acyl-carrier-protein] synthase [Eubacteriales bacterium]|nr:3-oxoacyl-[acyl-carrier-protein] synthase [Eubacteriales bacterium]
MKGIIPAGITGTGSYLPEKVLSNFDLEKMVDTSDEWIRTRTGIRERRIAAEGEATSDLGAAAARRALEDAGVDPAEVELIICATVTPDMLFPATACLIQKKIGAGNAAAFDLSAGCSGFVYALAVGAGFINNGCYRKVLVVGAEVLSRITDWTDRSTCVLFGDGAGAVLLEPVPEGYGLLAVELGANGSYADLIYLPGGGSLHPCREETVRQGMHYIKMSGQGLFKIAVKVMEEASLKAIEKAGLKLEDVDFLIPHQANIRIIEAAAKRLNLDMERVYVNIDRYGNISAATIPVALDEAWRQGRLREGDNVVLVGFGAGMTWAAGVLRWSKKRREGEARC